MFRKPTVFVLGAGASWHYGYPTGEQLVGCVIEIAKKLSGHCTQRVMGAPRVGITPQCVLERALGEAGLPDADRVRLGWQRLQGECDRLVERLRSVRPLVIDYFLFQNPDLRSIGKLMIAAAILEREGRWTKRGGNDNRRTKGVSPGNVDLSAYEDNWVRFVVHRLLNGCKSSADFAENKVRFVTFNYDVSLEFHMASALKDTQILDDIDVTKFVTDRTVHVYGSVHASLPSKYGSDEDVHALESLSQVDDDRRRLDQKMEFLDRCLVAAASIRTIGQHDKGQNEADLARAREWINTAAVVYILGYGFDPQNSGHIGLDKLSVAAGSTDKTSKNVLFTNFGDPNTVNKRAGNLLLGDPNAFLKGRDAVKTERRRYFEKSERDVYQAFAQDFDEVEEY
jgi:hypothetical protein